jgi:hypothetical protein
MNENEFDLTARAWLEDGPTRMADHALLSALEEIHTTRQRRAVWPAWRATPAGIGWRGRPTLQRVSLVVAYGIAAVALVTVGSVLVANLRTIQGPAAPTSTLPASGPTSSGGMWPQSTLDEVRLAQERAEAGDPAYTWQVGARIVDHEPYTQVDAELVDRFLREALGWESYEFQDGGVFSDWAGTGDGWVEGSVSGQQYRRCAAGGTNLLYPDASCAPTLDDLHYETVSFDMAQLARAGRDGIWVVTGWRSAAPFVQAVPADAEADARRRLEAFLAARVAGSGAERDVLIDDRHVLPLLYATTSGARYERYELERLEGPDWPDGRMTFRVRLIADGGATVVEQEVAVQQGNPLWVRDETTTENGQPVPLSHASPDGSVSVTAPATWQAWLNGTSTGVSPDDVWFGALWRVGDFFGGEGEQVELTDPVAFDAWCGAQGGSPLLSGPASAAEIAQQVIADPTFESTAPVAARIGGLEAVSMDVTLAPGGDPCGAFGIEISRWVHAVGPGERLRLYLVDLPEGMPVRTLAVTVVATQDRFDDVIAETAPIIDSIEFHPNATATPTVVP